jgi:hypothetical protein
MLDEAELLQTVRRRWEALGEDEDSAHGIYSDDAVLEFPQSGDRFEGVQGFGEWRRQLPVKLEFQLRCNNRLGDMVVAEYVIAHSGTPWLFTVSILELEDDRVAHERIYVTEGWEPAKWRAPWRAEQPEDPAPPWLNEPPQAGKSWYTHPLGVAGIILATLIILVSLVGSVFEPEKSSSSSQQGPDGSAEQTGATGVMGKYSARVEKEVGRNFGGGRVTSRCNMTDRTWHCYFDKYFEFSQPGRIEVGMLFPTTVSAAEARKFAEVARLHTFNMAGPSIESLDTVVSTNNGVYSGTTYREEVRALNNRFR